MQDAILCLQCVLYQGSGVSGFEYLPHTCTACPDGIPRETLDGDPRVHPANQDCKFSL